MKLIVSEHGDFEEQKAGAAFQFYPRAEEVWVHHVLEVRGGVKEMRCVRCGFFLKGNGVEAPNCLLNFFVRGEEEFSCSQPRGRFVAVCRPWFVALPALPFAENATVQVLKAKEAL